MISDPVLISIISTIGGVIIAYLANGVVKRRRAASVPKDRMETIFDGYEGLIKQQQLDIEHKQDQLEQSQTIINRLQHELEQTRDMVSTMQLELQQSKQNNLDLISQLATMKREFNGRAKA